MEKNKVCAIPDFGYAKDFHEHYTIGELLSQGQSRYIYNVATSKFNGDRFAVKRCSKSKMVRIVAVESRPVQGRGDSANLHNMLVNVKEELKNFFLRMSFKKLSGPKPMAYAVDSAWVEDVKREVEILKDLSVSGGHENVVKFYNAFEDQDNVYIVMELCEGGNLFNRLTSKANCEYSEEEAIVVVRQMLKIAEELHLQNLVHRDMQLENFFFKSAEPDSPLKLTEFGLAEFLRPGTKFDDLVGFTYFVAPEVLLRKSGPESDVWSIGLITYMLLSGTRPFWDRTAEGIFKKILKSEPDFRGKPWSTTNEDAKDFVKKLLKRDPLERLTATQGLSHEWVRQGKNATDIQEEKQSN